MVHPFIIFVEFTEAVGSDMTVGVQTIHRPLVRERPLAGVLQSP